jgi:hypothetical protein
VKPAVPLLAAALLLAEQKPLPRVDWVQLRGYNYRTGRINDDAKSLNGVEGRMIGYMVPFDDDQNRTAEFLLVPQSGQCIHVPPPPPNQIVLVQVRDRRGASVVWDRPVEVTGRITIGEATSPYGRVLYRMLASQVRVVSVN